MDQRLADPIAAHAARASQASRADDDSAGHAPARPLDGIRVLDLTRVVSGPFATMHLGDLGAEVIKIEEPTRGDDSRAFGPPFVEGESAYFLCVNRNKRSCAIDLKHEAGRALLLSLVKSADVVIENFRPGTMQRLGLDPQTLRQHNPQLIYCSISGFGSQGPDAQRPGYDLIVQGEAGVMDITGEPDGQPTKVGTSIADMIAGLFAAQGILSALYERTQTGVARHVEVSMLDALASLLTFNASIYFATGQSPSRRGTNIRPSVPTRPSKPRTAGSISGSPTTSSGVCSAMSPEQRRCSTTNASSRHRCACSIVRPSSRW